MKCPLKKCSTEEINYDDEGRIAHVFKDESFGDCDGKDCKVATVMTTGLNSDKERIDCNYNNIFGGKK